MAGESRGTVLLALAANLLIALAKTAAGLLTLSSSLLSEAAHSWADTLNQVFLLASLLRSRRPPDATHPFGYGKERFFWSLLAAVGIFVTGGGFSIYQGVHTLVTGGEEISTDDFIAGYAVLFVALLLEGSSLLRAISQLRGEARAQGRSFVTHTRKSTDPTVKTVLSEDSGAVAGILLAFLGLGLHKLTGSSVYDGAASIAIGVLLAWIAYRLGKDTKDLLIGEAADPALRLDIIHIIASHPEVDSVLQLLTMHLAPEELLVAAKVDFAPDVDSADIERVSTEIERDLCQRYPTVRHVFLDATTGSADERRLAAEVEQLAADDAAGDPAAPQQLQELERRLERERQGSS